MGYEMPNSKVEFGQTEFADDRPFKEFKFEPITLEQAIENGDIDLVSRLGATKELLFVILMTSNFSFSATEIRRRTEFLADSLGELDEVTQSRLSDRTMLSSTAFNRVAGVLEKHYGVETTSSDNKIHYGHTVFSVFDSNVFRAAIIAGTILTEKPNGFCLPEKFISNGHSNFKQQIKLLNTLNYREIIDGREINEMVSAHNSGFPSVSKLILDPLLQAKFIEREDHYMFIERDKLDERILIDSLLLEYLGTNTNTVLSYGEFRRYLYSKFHIDKRVKGSGMSDKEIDIKLSSAIANFESTRRIDITADWSSASDIDPGNSEVSRKYRIAADGRKFIEMVRSYYETPESLLGESKEYYIFDNDRLGLNDFAELSLKYKDILISLLKRLLNK